jgi:hypothetical protein
MCSIAKGFEQARPGDPVAGPPEQFVIRRSKPEPPGDAGLGAVPNSWPPQGGLEQCVAGGSTDFIELHPRGDDLEARRASDAIDRIGRAMRRDQGSPPSVRKDALLNSSCSTTLSVPIM